MKNPNHYGTVTKLSGKRRKPWIVREGQSGLQKPIGYAETKEEALVLLARYNKSPWDIEAEKVTLKELYELWLQKKAHKLGHSHSANLRCAYKYLKQLENMRYSQLKSFHMQEVIDNSGKGYSTQAAIKCLFGHLDNFALELDVITRQYSGLLTIAPMPESNRSIFTDDEVKRIWDNMHLPWVDSIIFLLYTGFRFAEFLELKTENVDLTVGTIKGGNKTAAGKNRLVPIHHKIEPIVKRHYGASRNGFLWEHNGSKLYEKFYRDEWQEIMKKLEINHTPHECRHTLRSWLDSANANKVAIDRIMGHKSRDIGERVYTHKSIEELKQAIELVA